MRRVNVTQPKTRRVQVKASDTRQVGQAGLATALGAYATQAVRHSPDTPLGFAAIRQTLMEELRSTGGRPGFAGAERRKIPVTEPVWQFVEQIAAQMAAEGLRASPAQVAGVILMIAARGPLSTEITREAKHALKASKVFSPTEATTSQA